MTNSAGIVFVSGTLEVGGSETKIVNIANALAETGQAVGIAYLNPPETLLEKVSPQVPVTNLRRHGKYSLSSVRRLGDLVGKDCRVLLAVNFYPLLYVLPAAKVVARNGAKTVCLVNTTDFVDRQWIWGHFYAPFLRRCDRIVYGCMAQQQMWTKKYRLPADRSRVIYNGVSCQRFSPGPDHDGRQFRESVGIPGDAVVLGSIGRFAPEKNFELLIEATAVLSASGRLVYLVLVGEGREAPALEAAARHHGIADKVVFSGILSDVRPALSAMDVFVLPSRAVETFSNAALEAMAMARPVVLSKMGGAAEMIVDRQSGYLFESGNREQLVEILGSLYDSASKRENAGKAARQRVLEKFEFQVMLDDYRNLINSVCS